MREVDEQMQLQLGEAKRRQVGDFQEIFELSENFQIFAKFSDFSVILFGFFSRLFGFLGEILWIWNVQSNL